jgi:glycosyltransferase involved in cell wall biosynthesis
METKQKILFVITKSNFGGAQRYVYELATSLPKNRFEAVVACGGDGLLVEKLTAAGIRVLSIPSFARDIDLAKEAQSLRELQTLFRAERPNIVHLNSSKAGGSGALIARLCGVPHIVFTAHGWPFFEKRNLLARIAIWVLSYLTVVLAHRTIVVSRHDSLHARMPFVDKKICQIYTAVPDIAFIEREAARTHLFSEEVGARHRNDLWVVSTGEHTRNKNLHALLGAVAAVNQTGGRKIFLTLMSDGEERTVLETFVTTHSLREYVHFTGFVDNARTYLKAFDVFILPSLKEGFPYGLLEAGAAGLGCIASAVGGIPEILTADTGLLVNPHDTRSIADALTQYAETPGLSAQHGTVLAARIRTAFDLDTMLAKTMGLYDSMRSRAT